MFEKIGNIITDRKLTPKECAYYTLRELPDGGKLRVLVIKGESQAHVEYICSKCKEYGYKMETWKRPFQFKCDNCGATIKVPKLKGKKQK